MVNTHPKVSVVIATYNRAHFIREAIDSVLAQVYTDYEIVVVDDGSTDTTREVVLSYGDKVRYFYQANQGKSTAQNYAVSQAKGEYIALLDDDDVWFPNKLAVQMELLEREPELGFVCSESYLIDIKGGPIRHWKRKSSNEETFASLYRENFIQHSSVVVRRRFLEMVGGLDVTLRTTEDYDLWLKLARVCKFKYISMPLVNYRQHAGSKHLNTAQKLKDRVRVVSKPENIAHVGFLKGRARIAREYYIHAQYYQDYEKYKMASVNFLKAALLCPTIGTEFAGLDANGFPISRIYCILRTYIKILRCFWMAIRTNDSKG